MNNCLNSNYLDIRPSNIISLSNCTYTYNNGIYHIIKTDDTLNVTIYFGLDFHIEPYSHILFNTMTSICNSNYSPSIRLYNGSSLQQSISSNYLNGNRVGENYIPSNYFSNLDSFSVFIMNAPHEFDLNLSKLFLQSGDTFTGFETYNCESLVPVVPEPTINGLHLYSMIEDNFITDNYYLNCSIIALFFTMIIIFFCAPLIIIKKLKE